MSYILTRVWDWLRCETLKVVVTSSGTAPIYWVTVMSSSSYTFVLISNMAAFSYAFLSTNLQLLVYLDHRFPMIRTRHKKGVKHISEKNACQFRLMRGCNCRMRWELIRIMYWHSLRHFCSQHVVSGWLMNADIAVGSNMKLMNQYRGLDRIFARGRWKAAQNPSAFSVELREWVDANMSLFDAVAWAVHELKLSAR